MCHSKTPRHNSKRQFAYKEIKSKYALKLALPHITWGLIWDTKKREERTTKTFLEKSLGLEKLKLR